MFWCPSKPNLFSQTDMDKISKVIFINKIVLRFLLHVMMLQTETYTDTTNEWSALPLRLRVFARWDSNPRSLHSLVMLV